ncbi:MAG TPA: glycosyltransferase family 39 protein [Candidatus Paceibacterota bacterium]
MAKFRNYYVWLAFGLIALGVIIFSLNTLTTKPRLWYDEGLNIEVSRNISYFGKIEVQTSPGNFSGSAVRMFQATGYAVTVPLAAFFKIFGFGPEEARVYMLLWMTAALFAVFYLVKKLAGAEEAFASLLLISTFPPFYDNGRTVIGEVPGFLFLIVGAYFLIRGKYIRGGLFLGLSIATKASTYIAILPAVAVYFFLAENLRPRKFFHLCVGIIPPMILEVFFVLAHPFSVKSWTDVVSLFVNPYKGSVGLFTYFWRNIISLPKTTTIIYFLVLFAVVATSHIFSVKRRVSEESLKKIFIFSAAYIFFAFIYYLKSPGWLRYLIAAELLVLILFTVYLKQLIVITGSKKRIYYIVLLALVIFQGWYLATHAKIYYSNSEEEVLSVIEGNFPGKSVGVINIPQIASFIAPAEKYQTLKMVGVEQVGENPLLYDPPPDVLVFRTDERRLTELLKEGERILNERYSDFMTIGRYSIYKKRGGF